MITKTIRKSAEIDITDERPSDGDYFVVETQENIIHQCKAVSDGYDNVYGNDGWYPMTHCWKVNLNLNPIHNEQFKEEH